MPSTPPQSIPKATVMVAHDRVCGHHAASAPTGLAASNVTQTSLTLSWNASTDNVGVSGYDVYRNGTKMASVTSTSSSQGGLACGTAYWFGVEALDAAGNRSARVSVNATTAACPPPPAPPPPPPSGSIYWGARIDGEVYGGGDAPWDSASWDAFESHAGKKVSIVEMGQPFGAHDLNAFNLIRARGAIPLLAMGVGSFTIEQIGSGAADAAIDAWAIKVGIRDIPSSSVPGGR